VNSVSPGLIATPTIRQILTDVPEMLISMVNRTYNVVDGGTTVLI
jgi:hypothetical protein